jgi:hypothetical protein
VDLLRAWARPLAAASMAVVCVPLAIGCALVVLAFAGGFGSLGSLEEIISGPRAAPAPVSVIRLAPVASPRPVPASPGPRLGAAGVHVGSAARGGVTAPPTRSPAPVHLGAAPVFRAAPTAQPARRLRSAPPEPPARPTTIDRVVSLVTSVTDKLPAPVGAVASRTVQSLAGAVPPPARVSLP